MNQAGVPGDPEARHPACVFTASIRRCDLVAAYPELNPACDRIGFGWNAPLKAHQEHPDQCMLELARSARPPYVAFSRDWRKAGIEELIHDIVKSHHAPLRNELRRLEILMAKALHHYPDLARKSFFQQYQLFVSRQLAHLDQEEYVIFPLCINEVKKRGQQMAVHDQQQIRTAIGEMSNGHVDTEAFLFSLTAQMRPFVGQVRNDLTLVSDGLVAMQEDLSVHQMKEDGILVPAMYALAG